MTLDVLISTLGYDGIKRVAAMNLPVADNVNYIVSWQLPDANDFPGIIPVELHRKDISVFPINNKGLSNNRNNAIKHSTGDICLIADDDLKYTTEQLLSVLDIFKGRHWLDIATFKYSGNDNKRYPDHEFNLQEKQKGYYISSVEIAFRRLSIYGRIEFSTYWGLGAKHLHAGEETLFMIQAMHAGLTCRFFPITITHHNDETTGNRSLTPGVLMAQGAYFSIVHPVTAFLRIPLFAWRNSRRGLTRFWPAVKHLLRGYLYGHRHFNSDGSLKRVPERA